MNILENTLDNPCKECIVNTMCKKSCQSYEDYVSDHLKEYNHHTSPSLIASYLIRKKPSIYYVRLNRKSNATTYKVYRAYTILMKGTTIIGIEHL